LGRNLNLSKESINNDSLNYRDAGVDIDAGNELIHRIKPLIAKTRRPESLGSIGGFAALFEIPLDRYQHPVLVSATDGVGTKLKLAIESGIHHSIGIDLVAMCVNDLIVQGAEPLFFLDYYATAKLDLSVAEDVIRGICDGCEQAGAALVGGETAEMPGMYRQGDYDLAGFCVGIVEKDNIVTGEQVKPGDQVIGIHSSGPHSNGYSLIRKIIERSEVNLSDLFIDKSFAQTLLEPTTIYVKPILKLLQQVKVSAMAHITGGGLLENLPRVLPDTAAVTIDSTSWQRPEIFNWLQDQGAIASAEMLRTFNCGIGYVLILQATDVETTLKLINAEGLHASVIGEVTSRTNGSAITIR